MPFPFDIYPWTNYQELNLAYFIARFQEIFRQWADLYDTMTAWKAQTDADLETWKDGVISDINARETALRQELAAWKATTEQDISSWEAATLAALAAWQTAAETQFEAIRVQAAASATAAAGSASDAAAAKTAAETAQAAAESAAASAASTLANAALISQVPYPQGALAANTDVDTIDTNGRWWISSSNTYTHLPTGMTNGFLMSVLTSQTGTSVRFQLAYSNDNKKLYARYHTSSGWGTWTNNLEGLSNYALIANTVYPSGALASGDVDAITAPSIYWLNPNNTYTHLPTGTTNGVLITMITTIGGTNIRLQILYSNNKSLLYARYRTSSGWGSWIDNLSSAALITNTVYPSGALASGDVDTITAPSIYWINPNNTYTHLPDAMTNGTLITMITTIGGTSIRMQIAYSANIRRVYVRYHTSAGWAPWVDNREDLDPVDFYGKKVILGGASVAQGFGGTDFFMDGELIITVPASEGTYHTAAYNTEGENNLWRRNPGGYCWANLFANLLTTNYSCTVINNACMGTDFQFWKRHAADLIPEGYDIFIYSCSGNDRGTDYDAATVKSRIYDAMAAVQARCHSIGTRFIVASAPPTTAADEAAHTTTTWQLNEWVKDACARLGVKYLPLNDEIIKYYYMQGAATAGTYSDSKHPDDAMYYRMFFCYCWLLSISPSGQYIQPPT